MLAHKSSSHFPPCSRGKYTVFTSLCFRQEGWKKIYFTRNSSTQLLTDRGGECSRKICITPRELQQEKFYRFWIRPPLWDVIFLTIVNTYDEFYEITPIWSRQKIVTMGPQLRNYFNEQLNNWYWCCYHIDLMIVSQISSKDKTIN